MANEDLKEIIRNSDYGKRRYRAGWSDGVFSGLLFCGVALVVSLWILFILNLM